MIDNSIYTKKRIFKVKPQYLQCLILFEKHKKLNVDEFITAYRQEFSRSITRKNAFNRIYRLYKHGYVKHTGLKTYRLSKKEIECSD